MIGMLCCVCFFFQTDIMAVMTKQGKEKRLVGEYRQQAQGYRNLLHVEETGQTALGGKVVRRLLILKNHTKTTSLNKKKTRSLQTCYKFIKGLYLRNLNLKKMKQTVASI